ncbi:hypothetical protein ACTXIU_13030 [Glutamicibacter arilaitensis]|uniref:hypothetical protein n=1 Tax=Glutamicibacter arilaitensis TaxID=256701 RepID=UPI003FD3D971
MKYRVIANPNVSEATAKLAPSYERLEDAHRASGTGLVIDQTGRVISFHERHLPLMQAGATTYRP